jgi:hypothetical protein
MSLSADFGVTSYRKLLPVPDGAKVMSKAAINIDAMGISLAAPDEAFISGKLVGKVLRAQGAGAEDFLPLLEESEAIVERQIIPRRRSHASQWMLGRMDLSSIVSSRRANWLRLRELLVPLVNAGRLQLLMPILDSNDVPLGHPVIIADGMRDRLKQHLAERDIYCPVHWTLDFLPEPIAFARELGVAASVLTLPIDQRMTNRHVEYMADSITGFFREIK